MASIVAKVNNSNYRGHLSSLSIQEKGSRNKRKFRADPRLSNPNKVLTSVVNDRSSYELSAEKFEISTSNEHPPCPCDMCGMYEDQSDAEKLDLGMSIAGTEGSSEYDPSQIREELESDEFQDPDWSDLTENQLEEFVMTNLDAIFRSAIKRIVASGYSEEVATKAIMRSGLCSGAKDTVSNVVDHALVILRNGQDNDSSGERCFQDLHQLEKYVLAELICVLRDVRPFFSNGDAMWCLLVCDMNVSHACAMDADPLSSMINDGSHICPFDTPKSQSKAKPKTAKKSLPKPCKPIRPNTETANGDPNPTKQKYYLIHGTTSVNECPPSSSCSPLIPLEKPFNAEMSHTPAAVVEKLVAAKKTHSTSSKREYSMIRQRSLHQLEKTYRVSGIKGTFRAAKLSGFILDKRGKPVTDSATLGLKTSSIKMTKAMARGLELTHESGTLDLSRNPSLSSNSATFTIESKSATSQLAETSSFTVDPIPKPTCPIPTVLPADTKLSLSLSTQSDSEAPNPIYYPMKDKVIVKLLPRVRELENQLQDWTEWANRKVMQAAKRLGKDKAELKTLRQEKEDMERLKNEKQTLKENSVKKLYEMENALGKASDQIQEANASVRRLEVETASLKQDMESAKLKAAESAASCQEDLKREKETLMKIQSWEKEKGIFQEELATERRKFSQLQQELAQAESLHTQLLARWKQEEKTKDELQNQANSIRNEREQLEASTKSKEDSIRVKAESKLQKYKDDILKLENELSQLRQRTDSSKIAALKKGIDGSYANMLPNSQTTLVSKEVQDYRVQDLSGVRGVNRDRECVMCLSEEMSVVFLPCAHQVVCRMCNELHEKQGMNECPSCRSTIIQRISVRYCGRS